MQMTLGIMPSFSDTRGDLFVGEYQKDIPFLVRRIYYICNVEDSNVIRGFHAHKELHQIMFCVGGTCDIILDNGCERITVPLDMPGKYVYIQPGLWREMTHFSKNATLMVLASAEYDEGDYIREYDEFLRYISE